MKAKRGVLLRIGALLLVLIVAGLMFIVGRGHTIYFDNKTFEYGGETYSAVYRATVLINGEQIAKLAKRERGMATCIGQNLSFELQILLKKGEEPVSYPITLKLPYNLDGIVINIPAYLAEFSQDVYMTEFVSMIEASEDDGEEEILTDEFGLSDI